LPPIKVGCDVEAVSYCNSKKSPAFDAVGVVAVFVVVSVSNTYAARESFVERGVDDFLRMADSKCDRTVVLPEPDSPLYIIRLFPH
jgi:hypothetical protein